MTGVDALTTFTDRSEVARAQQLLERLGIEHAIVSPDPAYERVGCPALVLTPEAKAAYLDNGGAELVGAGWVEYRPSAQVVPQESPPEGTEELLPRIAIVVLAPCVADPEKLRLIAHLEGDAGEALPFVNADLQKASYTAKLPVLTYMDGHRMVSLFRDRVAIAKADNIVDAWASLERLRCTVNEVWSRRDEIEPSFEARRRPPALEIYKRLPGHQLPGVRRGELHGVRLGGLARRRRSSRVPAGVRGGPRRPPGGVARRLRRSRGWRRRRRLSGATLGASRAF